MTGGDPTTWEGVAGVCYALVAVGIVGVADSHVVSEFAVIGPSHAGAVQK
jgi:hypothetical protein